MSVLILDHRLEGEAVRVTAADYCASAENPFDGSPFSVVPEWLQKAIMEHKVVVHPDNRDYACWKILTPKGEVIAEPGDIIMDQPGTGMTVYTRKTGR